MALTDTAEYWNDLKEQRNRIHFSFTHLKRKDCGYYHKYETEKVGDVDCYACIKLFTDEERVKYKKVQRKREMNRQKKIRKKNNRILRKYLNKQKDIDFPFCICGKPMIKRVNKKIGEKFWGCWDYPKCKHTRSI
jgi:hypothetical protein